MYIYYEKYRITDCLSESKKLAYGYVVQEKVGEQYKRPTYFPKLDWAANEMFERALQELQGNNTLDMANLTEARKVLREFATKLDGIRVEIMEVCRDRNE